MFCAYTRRKYQMSVYRTIGPLVSICYQVVKMDLIWHDVVL